MSTKKVNELIKKGHLIHIYEIVGETLCIVGYQRKPSSRKSHQRPYMLNQPIPLGPIASNPEPSTSDEQNTGVS